MIQWINGPMNKFLLTLVFALAFISATAQTQTPPRRITFARGATVARATGYLRGVRDEKWFVLRARAHQHMRVEIKGRGATRGVLYFPSGKQDGGPGGVIFDGVIDENGDYRIRVTESSMANAWSGSFTVTVEILPPGQLSGDTINLDSYAGKYPSELFRDVPSIKARLRGLLGKSYSAFFERMQVEMPIEKAENTIIVRGCKAHQCTIEEAILAIDLSDGQPYVAMKFGRHFKTYAADRSRIPGSLKRAMAQ
jgi:hypothetical protein